MASNAQDELAPFIIPNIPQLPDVLSRELIEGCGSYGAVYNVPVNGISCIAKKLHKALVDQAGPYTERRTMQVKFRREAIILSKLTHPNVVHFVGVHFGQDKYDLTILMEQLDRDLDDFLNKEPVIPLSIKLSILLDVSYGLLYLHSQQPPVIHRDLTARNILLTANGLTAKIADLGVAKLLDAQALKASKHTQVPGQMNYMPSEALKKDAECSPKIDVFSFGHLALYTVTQKFPGVYDLDAQVLIDSVQKGIQQIERRRESIDLVGTSHCLYPLIHQCLRDHPEARPTALELNRKMKELSTAEPKELLHVAKLCNCEPLQASEEQRSLLQHQLEKVQEELQDEKDRAEVQQIDLYAHVQDLMKRLENAENDKQKLQDQVHVFQAQAATFKADFEDERNDREKAQSRFEDEQARTKLLEAKATTLETYLAQLLEEKEQETSRVKVLEAKITSLENQLKQSKKEALQSKKSAATLEKKLNEKETKSSRSGFRRRFTLKKDCKGEMNNSESAEKFEVASEALSIALQDDTTRQSEKQANRDVPLSPTSLSIEKRDEHLLQHAEPEVTQTEHLHFLQQPMEISSADIQNPSRCVYPVAEPPVKVIGAKLPISKPQPPAVYTKTESSCNVANPAEVNTCDANPPPQLPAEPGSNFPSEKVQSKSVAETQSSYKCMSASIPIPAPRRQVPATSMTPKKSESDVQRLQFIPGELKVELKKTNSRHMVPLAMPTNPSNTTDGDTITSTIECPRQKSVKDLLKAFGNQDGEVSRPSYRERVNTLPASIRPLPVKSQTLPRSRKYSDSSK